MNDLKRCPFCGSNEVHVSVSNYCTGVFCEGCSVFTYPIKNDGYGDTEECEKRAIEAWNKRYEPSEQSEDWMAKNKDRILRAGMEGREVEFRIGGRLFAIREKAQ